MKRNIGRLVCLTVAFTAMPALRASADHTEGATHEAVSPEPDRPDPGHTPLGEGTGWPPPEPVDAAPEPLGVAAFLGGPFVYMTRHWTRDVDYVERDVFMTGERVYWTVGVQNDTGADASITGVWDVDDPNGSPVFTSNPTWTVPPGYSAWQYNGEVGSVEGWYSFFASVEHQGDVSQGTRYYLVLLFADGFESGDLSGWSN